MLREVSGEVVMQKGVENYCLCVLELKRGARPHAQGGGGAGWPQYVT